MIECRYVKKNIIKKSLSHILWYELWGGIFLRHYAVLRLLLACFFLYFAWPVIPLASTELEKIFWGAWLLFLVLVIGGNLSTLLQLSDPPIMEQEQYSGSRLYKR